MRMLKSCSCILTVVAALTLASCSAPSNRILDLTDSVRASLDRAGLKEVSANHDREKGVITLGGQVAVESDKAQAESIAKSLAGSQVVANQIAVVSTANPKEAKAINTDLDKGIESNLDAALIAAKLHDSVKYTVKNHVVTLTGEVDSQTARSRAGEAAATVPNVNQVVNTLQIRAQKATSSL